MISESDSCMAVAKRLGLPPQTLYNWYVAYRDGSEDIFDAVRLSPEERNWILENAEKRLNALNQRAGTAKNLSEIAFLNHLQAKIDR